MLKHFKSQHTTKICYEQKIALPSPKQKLPYLQHEEENQTWVVPIIHMDLNLINDMVHTITQLQEWSP